MVLGLVVPSRSFSHADLTVTVHVLTLPSLTHVSNGRVSPLNAKNRSVDIDLSHRKMAERERVYKSYIFCDHTVG